TKKLRQAEKIAGVTVVGYKLSASQWPFDELLRTQNTILYSNTFDLVRKRLPQIPEAILKRAYKIAEVPIKAPLVYLPLITKEKNIGAFSIWGYRLENANEDILRLFANQIAITLDNARRYETEKQINEELSRSKAFTAALGTVAAEVGQTKNSDRIIQVLGDELNKLGLGNLLVRLSADGEIATIDSISTTTEALESIKKFTGIDLKGYEIKRKYWKSFAEDYFYQGKALFITNPVEFTSIVMPKIPFGMLEKALKLSIGHTKDKAVYLPLIDGKENYGILGIWGVDLHEEDIPALSIFASQVSATMQSAEEIESEREETSKVTRANHFITALSQVALKLESTSDPNNILDILSTEMREHKISFMLTTLEEDNSMLTLRYISTAKEWLKIIDQLIKRRAIGTPLQKRDIPFWNKIIESKESVIVEDSFQVALEGIASTIKIPMKNIEPGLKILYKRANWSNISIWHPLVTNGKVIGTVNFWGKHIRREDRATLSVFANQIASALENARLYANEQQRGLDLAASLEEKSVLLKEVHHRVKNNLQVISSLLNLQASKISDAEILDMFTESRDRIRSMALIHEKLYQSSDLAQVDFGEYLRGLSAQLMQSYSSQSRRIKMNVEIENISLGIDQAVTCGLIVNEIVTNSIKHAFPDYQEGEITIQLHNTPRKQVKLRIIDNGIGIPNSLSIENSSTLGMQIISLLTEQIGGKVRILRQHGTGFEIIF
ncbi:MAG: hypothetical protein HN392_13660, partial [Anaerolineae bacterium]|nr:hypothetical protein [Anaerolineae bacterium]